MKENKYDNRIEIKKKKIFNVQILNKKLKLDNSNVNDFKQSPKKRFIFYKPTIDLNTKQNIIKK